MADDLSAAEPERAEALLSVWRTWRKDVFGEREVAQVDLLNVAHAP